MVTHNLASITEYSDRAIYLEAGKIKAQGSSEKVIAKYKADLKKK
jgi:ABC-type polysaccharide/polyol phosphate transport system ATPase subunit